MSTTNIYPVTNIEKRRRALGWTKAELAARAGVHRNTVGRLESPRPDLSQEKIEQALTAAENWVPEI